MGTHQPFLNIAASNDGTKLVAATFGGNLWTSNDAGGTWAKDSSVGEAKDWKEIQCTSSDGMTWLATEDSGKKWISSNSGATWIEHLISGKYQSEIDGEKEFKIELSSGEAKVLQFTMSQGGTQMACFEGGLVSDYLDEGFRFTSTDLGYSWMKQVSQADVRNDWISIVLSSLVGCQHSMLDFYEL
jgi:hypothetical protein